MKITASFKDNMRSSGRQSIRKQSSSPSFKASAGTVITSVHDKALMSIYSQYFGSIGNRTAEKLYKLISESDVLKKSSRISEKNGTLLITDKNAGRSIFENLIFPFLNLPLNGISALLKKMQGASGNGKARELYNKPIFRIPRKLNELDEKSDILKGMLEITESTVKSAADKIGLAEDKLIEILLSPKEKLSAKEQSIADEAGKYIHESLYKSGSKFFDKHTGNFNTAHERPLNRIVTGLVPAAFLANDAYNLSVLCGDKKEDSEKEAKARKKQELLRIFTTAYIQLMIFGAFTKQVNTIPWFAPVTSAATVLVSEIFSRKKLGRPVFFLSKEKAQEYNRREDKNKKPSENKENSIKAAPAASAKSSKTSNYSSFASSSAVFKDFSDKKQSFGAADTVQPQNKAEKQKKQEKSKSLINFQTFKKGVILFTSLFTVLSFLKNSPLTKDSKIIKGISDFGASLKKKFYDPYAYKDFEMTQEKFNSVMQSLKDAGCSSIAGGHEFIKGMYAKETSKGVFKLFKASMNSEGIEAVLKTVQKEAQKINPSLTEKDRSIINEAVKTALKLTQGETAERKYDAAAKKAIEIIKNKKAGLNSEQASALEKSITEAIGANVKETAVKIDSAAKPFVDILTEPFKFIYASVRLPFKLLNAAVNMITAPVQKKAAQAALGKAELSNFEQAVNKTVTGIFGEKQAKSGKISQTVFANAMEQLERKTLPFRNAQKAYNEAVKAGKSAAEISELHNKLIKAQNELGKYADTAAAKSFNGVTQSSNKNTDLALMSKLASSAVTTAFLVADNYNMVMLKSNGKDTERAEEMAKERIIQRLSGLFYQALFINWFNSAFRSTYNSSLAGMTAVAIPNTLTTEILTRKSIGMPIRRKTLEELNKIEQENENKKGLTGKYFKFMRRLTGKKPLSERMPKHKLSAAA